MKALLPNSKTASKLIKEECDRRIDQTAQYMLACMTMVLLDKAHVSSDEIQTIIQEIEKLFNSINTGYLNFDDVINTLKEDYDINLHFVQKKGDVA